MAHFPNLEELAQLADSLDAIQPLPSHDDRESGAVCWHVFRERRDALEFARHIQLESGQRLIGGMSRDSIGTLWWAGVAVEDINAWGNRGAVNKLESSALPSL